jgi:hypothetical protein
MGHESSCIFVTVRTTTGLFPKVNRVHSSEICRALKSGFHAKRPKA